MRYISWSGASRNLHYRLPIRYSAIFLSLANTQCTVKHQPHCYNLLICFIFYVQWISRMLLHHQVLFVLHWEISINMMCSLRVLNSIRHFWRGNTLTFAKNLTAALKKCKHSSDTLSFLSALKPKHIEPMHIISTTEIMFILHICVPDGIVKGRLWFKAPLLCSHRFT